MSETVLAIAFDFDGALYKNGYDPQNPDALIQLNQALFDEIIKEALAKRYFVKLMWFTNRQCYDKDFNNSKKGKASESCFLAMEKISTYFKFQGVDDESKLAIIYAHLHYLASKHESINIIYKAFDDRLDILMPLGRLLTQ